MQIWNFDPTQENMLVHGGAAVADPDPLNPGQWLIPANATPVPAPADQPGQTRHFDAVSSVWYFKPIPPEPVKPPPTPDQIKDSIIYAVQSRLDDFARTRNYDGILSAATYATSTIQKFAAEGQYAVRARDATWAKLYQIMDEVTAGTRAAPSGYDAIAPDLPVLAWPL